MSYLLLDAENPQKKWMVITPNFKVVQFGDSQYEDYTQHKDEIRKMSYLRRHKPREDWNNPDTPGFWSRWLLWNRKTLIESIADIEKRFGLRIEY